MIRILCRAVMLVIIPYLVFSNDDNKAKISLLTETNDITAPFHVGIHFEMEPGWYIYWENPGDAGIPVEVQWNLPGGFSVSELIYPTPERFDTQGLISFGFKDEALILAKITPGPAAGAVSDPVITGEVSWMVCRESCYLEDGTVELNLTELEASPEIFARYKEKIPESIDSPPARITSVESIKADGLYHITITLAGEPVDDFFPGPVSGFLLPHNDIKVEDHSISYTLRPYSESAVVTEAGGLVFINGTAYRFNARVSTMNH